MTIGSGQPRRTWEPSLSNDLDAGATAIKHLDRLASEWYSLNDIKDLDLSVIHKVDVSQTCTTSIDDATQKRCHPYNLLAVFEEDLINSCSATQNWTHCRMHNLEIHTKNTMDTDVFCVICGGPFVVEHHIYGIDPYKQEYQASQSCKTYTCTLLRIYRRRR